MTKGDFPTDVKPVDRKALSLPCNVADQRIPSSAVLKGLFTSTTSGTSNGNYVSETVAVFPTATEAAGLFDSVSQKLANCHTYPSTYRNQTDTVTITSTPASFGTGDDSLYVEEKYTPQNYKGDVTSTSTALTLRGPVIIRLFTEYGNQADASSTKRLVSTLVNRVAAAT